MAKRRLLVLLLTVVIVLSLVVFAACNNTGSQYEIKVESSNVEISKGDSKILEYSVLQDGQEVQKDVVISIIEGEDIISYNETDGIKALKSGTAKVSIALKDNSDVNVIINVNVPTYTLAFSVEEKEVYVGESFTLPTTVKKDGAVVNGQKVNLSVEGDAITVSAMTKQITAVNVGEATLVATLDADPDVVARIKIIVKEAFFSRDVNRGNFDFANEENGSVEVLSGQATLVASKASTKFVFKTYIDIKSVVANNESIGIGSFLDQGDNALWFGLHGADVTGEYYVYIRNFYKGWAPAYDEVYTVGNYQHLTFDGKIEFIIVRDGCDYWYSIGGFSGTYSDGSLTDVETWPGIYSQEKMLTVSDYSVSYDQKDIDEAKALLSDDVAKIELTPSNINVLEKGTQQQFNIKVYSSKVLEETVAWNIDKSKMTAGVDGTVIENGLLTISNDAAGYITVKGSIAGKEASIRIEISSEELNKNSENIAVSGGVGLDIEKEIITFPEDRSFNNADLKLEKALDTAYLAKLLQSVKGDFTLEFKASKFESGSLVVALGGDYNNIVFSGSSVSVYGYSCDTNNKYDKGTVIGTASLSATDEHSYKIVVENGVYSIYVDDSKVELSGNVICNPNVYASERNISFTVTEGTSLSISNVSLTLSEKSVNGFYLINGNASLSDDGFTLAILNNQWAAKNENSTRICYIDEIYGNFVITYDVKFDSLLNDSKFAISIGDSFWGESNFEFHVNNKDTLEGEIYPQNWGGAKSSTQLSATDTNRITVQCIDGVATFYIGSKKIGSCNGLNGGKISFYTFGSSSDNGNVTVENFSIIKQFAVISGENSVQAGSTAEYVVSEYGDANAKVELDASGLTKGSAVLNSDNSVTISSDAEGSYIIKAIVGDYTSSISVTVVAIDAEEDLFITNNDNLSNVSSDGFTLGFEKQGWLNEGKESVLTYYTEDILGNDCDITFDVNFNVAEGDIKLCVVFGLEGNQEITICNNGNMCKIEVRDVWGGTERYNLDKANLSIKIEIRNGQATLTMGEDSKTVNVDASVKLGFYAFDESGAVEGTVSVSNFKVETVSE